MLLRLDLKILLEQQLLIAELDGELHEELIDIELKLEVGKLLEQQGLVSEEDRKQHAELYDGELFEAMLDEKLHDFELFEGEEQERQQEARLEEVEGELLDEHFIIKLEEWQLDESCWLKEEEQQQGKLTIDEEVDCVRTLEVGTLTLQKQSGSEFWRLKDNNIDFEENWDNADENEEEIHCKNMEDEIETDGEDR